jgi:hypothetical protein
MVVSIRIADRVVSEELLNICQNIIDFDIEWRYFVDSGIFAV